jgi:predicted nucleic acid-binding Zn ribbon protein
MQKFSDQPLTTCPQCGGMLSKLISLNSFQLKGGGWYVTDYAHKKDSAPNKPHDAKKDSATDKASSDSTAPTPAPADKSASPTKEPSADKA